VSGIAGAISSISGIPLESYQNEILREGIQYRGPDGLVEWSSDDAFFVHGHLASTPSPAHNLDDDTTKLRYLGEVRLDNRSEIAGLCGIPESHQISDIELIVRAYEKFGPKCCERFVGDFAFAIWNIESRTLFCARDPFGIKPFFYRETSTGFFFASDERALGASATDDQTDFAIAAFLAGIVEYSEETHHAGVRRLLGGHYLIWDSGGVNISKYWALETDIAQGDDPEAVFLERFKTAVADRLYGTEKVSVFLSGGMDSSAIAVMAEIEKSSALNTFSFVYEEGSEMDESPYIDAVLSHGNYAPHKELIQSHPPLDDVEGMLRDQLGLIVAPGMSKSRNLYKIASQNDIKVILDGHGGDEVIGYGSYRLIDMARQEKWFRLLPLIYTHCSLFGENTFEAWLYYFQTYAPKTKFSRIIRKLANRIYRYDKKKPPAFAKVLDEKLIEKTDLRERFDKKASFPKEAIENEAVFNGWLVLSNLMQSSFEILDKASAVAGVEARYPFFDTRLASFCIGLPSSEKLRVGQTRSILRRALKGILPSKVRLRQTKTSFHPEIIEGLRLHHDDILQEMERDPHNILRPYVNKTELHKLLDHLRMTPHKFGGGDAMFLWRLCCFYIWRRSSIDSGKVI